MNILPSPVREMNQGPYNCKYRGAEVTPLEFAGSARVNEPAELVAEGYEDQVITTNAYKVNVGTCQLDWVFHLSPGSGQAYAFPPPLPLTMSVGPPMVFRRWMKTKDAAACAGLVPGFEGMTGAATCTDWYVAYSKERP